MKYKTAKCKQFHEEGYCQFGSRCQFLHKTKGEGTQLLPKAKYSQIFESGVSESLLKKELSIGEYMDQYLNIDRLKISKLQIFSVIRGEISQGKGFSYY